jgi:hypothetical protein
MGSVEGFVVRRPLNPGTGNTDYRYSDLEPLGDGTLAGS